MYLLPFLKGALSQTAEDAVEIEYRIACSGEMYNGRVIAIDWRKSDITRVILRSPFELFVTSQPFNSYPQELCVRLILKFVTETSGHFSSHFLPDQDVIEDICSLLTLLSRRLLSPAQATRTKRVVAERDAMGSFREEMPLPIFSPTNVSVWKRRGVSILTSFEGEKLISHDPPAVKVNPHALEEFLRKFPDFQWATEVVYAARTYRAALEFIETRPDIAYQLLISTSESLAAVACIDYEPDEPGKFATQIPVQRLGKTFGLNEQQIKSLVLAACSGNRWLKRKFKKFLSDYSSLEDRSGKDSVFLLSEVMCPPPGEFDNVLGAIYDARSGNLHSGSPFPRSIGIGTGPLIESRALPLNPLQQGMVPPVVWFERIVSAAARKFLSERIPTAEALFTDAF